MTEARQLQPIEEVRNNLTRMEGQFAMVLPPHIDKARFTRVAITAVQENPDLLLADRQSLYSACMKCATDGLVPDKRDAALVVFNTKEKINGKDVWIKKVQYMPMVTGIMKRARNSGEIANWSVHVRRENDHFEFELGDDEKIIHRPALVNPGALVGTYSIVTFKNGERSREYMSADEVFAVRARSKTAESGPWKTDEAEMWRKSVTRRHAKRLPMDDAMRDFISQDDNLTDLDGSDTPPPPAQAEVTSTHKPAPKRPSGLAGVADDTIEEGSFQEPSASKPQETTEPTVPTARDEDVPPEFR